LIGISFTIFASAYSSDEHIGVSFGLWLIGLVFIGCWFYFGDNTKLEEFAMILVGIGQITFWGIVHYIKMELLTVSELYGAIIFVLIVWILSIIIFFYRSEQRDELEQKSLEIRTRPERKSFSKYVKDEILERQQNRCAMCNDKLFYCHFDHIDGNRSNNSLSNCQALCPNCHELKTRRDQKEKNDRFSIEK
jgi:uncharacterized membrane protein